MMFALMVPVIVTGAFAEKLTMKGFFVFVTVWPFRTCCVLRDARADATIPPPPSSLLPLTVCYARTPPLAVVYYPIAHWVWGGGWLSALGAIDFAGGITIHSVAGWAGMIVSLMLQKRRNIEKLEMTHHNIPMLVTGGTIVWAGW
jgi:Amt family ammonium transporter